MWNYAELLKSPHWQKKRLKIMDRDNFACQNCLEDEEMLQVHHIKYLKGRMPWEYPDKYLITLCHDCHEIVKVLNFRNRITFWVAIKWNSGLSRVVFILKALLRLITQKPQKW